MFDPNTGKAYQTDYALEDDSKSLVLLGIVVDSIATLGEPLDEEPFVLINDSRVRGSPCWLKYFSMAKMVAAYPTGETVWDAFWRTLAAGKDGYRMAMCHRSIVKSSVSLSTSAWMKNNTFLVNHILLADKKASSLLRALLHANPK